MQPALRPIEDAYPLTRMQQALLVRCLAYPDQPLYMGQWWAILEGDLDESAFAAAWQGVVDRHTALRSGFRWDLKDHPFQVVHRYAELKIHRDDWTAQPDWKAPLDAFLAQDRLRPFDIKKAPLMRIALIRLAPTRHLIVWTRHHLTVDGWSLGIILDQVFALYKASRAGEPQPLAPAPPFRAYVDWERSQDGTKAIEHWRQVLAATGAEEDNPLPTYQAPTRSASGPDIRATHHYLPQHLAASLDTLARQCRVTLNTIIQAAWAIVQSRLDACDKILFGSVEAVRAPSLGQSDPNALVGIQIQIQPVLAHLDQRPVCDWLADLQAKAAAAREAGPIGMDELRDLLALSADQLPFESLVGVQNYPLDQAGSFSGTGLRLMETGDVTLPDMPLNLMVERDAQGLCLRLIFDHHHYQLPQARLRLDMMAGTLAALAASPDQPVLAIDALPEAVTAAVLGSACASGSLPTPNKTVIAAILDQAALQPHATALSYGGQSWTYAALIAMAGTVAQRLTEHSVAPGARVGLHLQRTPLAIAAILGTLLHGNAYVPMDLDWPDARKAFVVEAASVAAVLTVGQDSFAQASVRTIDIAELGTTDAALHTDPPTALLPAGPDEAYVIFTSGSTGTPKGVSISHDNLSYHVASRNAAYPDQPHRILLLTFPLIFDGSVTGIFGTLCLGGALVLPRPVEASDPDRLAALIRDQCVTQTIMIPSQWSLLLSASSADDLSSLKMAVVAGESCPRDLVERHYAKLPKTRLSNEYGPTESTVWASYETDTVQDAGPVSIGRPIPGTRVYIVDVHNRLCPPGTVGELLIAGPGIAQGYIGHPELTAERFIANPFHHDEGFGRIYRTGDQVSQDRNGKLYFHGRADDQIKVSGYRIELGEIVARLLDLPDIHEAAIVIHRASPNTAPRIIAHVAGADLPDRETILSHARRVLPSYMMPHSILLHDRLPRTAAGKIDHHSLPAPPLQDQAATPPQGDTEQAIAKVWQAVLGRPTIDRFDNFFVIGGRSLDAMQVVSRLRRDLTLAVDLIDLLEAPQLNEFAQRLAQRGASQSPSIPKRQRVRVELSQATDGTRPAS